MLSGGAASQRKKGISHGGYGKNKEPEHAAKMSQSKQIGDLKRKTTGTRTMWVLECKGVTF